MLPANWRVLWTFCRISGRWGRPCCALPCEASGFLRDWTKQNTGRICKHSSWIIRLVSSSYAERNWVKTEIERNCSLEGFVVVMRLQMASKRAPLLQDLIANLAHIRTLNYVNNINEPFTAEGAVQDISNKILMIRWIPLKWQQVLPVQRVRSPGRQQLLARQHFPPEVGNIFAYMIKIKSKVILLES